MKNTGAQGLSLFIDSWDELEILLWLLKQVRLTPEKVALVKDLSKAFEIFEFQLGDSLISFGSCSPNQVQRESNSQYLYIVCQGRARLLSFDADKRREVSAQLLAAGETIGGDSLFCEIFLPYRAIAASTVRVARIPLEKLQPFLKRLPELQANWQAAAQQRQRLLFFKTLRELRSLPSHRLKQLSSYFVEKRIAAGECLPRAAPSEAGRFWLCCGKIQNQPPKISYSWGYPEATPTDWVAQTDLWVYQLPQQNWEAACALAPALATALGESAQSEPGPESHLNQDSWDSNSQLDRVMSSEQFNQIIEAILSGNYSWACVLILRFAGYNPLHYIPYRTYQRLING